MASVPLFSSADDIWPNWERKEGEPEPEWVTSEREQFYESRDKDGDRKLNRVSRRSRTSNEMSRQVDITAHTIAPLPPIVEISASLTYISVPYRRTKLLIGFLLRILMPLRQKLTISCTMPT